MRSLIRKILRENDEFDWIRDTLLNPSGEGDNLANIMFPNTEGLEFTRTIVPDTLTIIEFYRNKYLKMYLDDGRIWDVAFDGSSIVSDIYDNEDAWQDYFGGGSPEKDDVALERVRMKYPFVKTVMVGDI